MKIKTLTVRAILAFAALDLLFNPLVLVAFVQLLGVSAPGDAWLAFAGLIVLKIIACGIFLAKQLRPYDVFASARGEGRFSTLVAADAALQAAPARMGVFYALSWTLTYGLVYLVLRAATPHAMSDETQHAVLLVMVATSLGGFAFGFPLTSLLTADAASQCSLAARGRGIQLNRPEGSLQVRIAVIALALGLGPTLWMMALGYMKQVDASQTHQQTRAQLMAAELARAGSAPAIGSEAASGWVVDGSGNVLSGSGALPEPAREYLRERGARASEGVYVPAERAYVLAFRRIDPERLAVAALRSNLGSTSSYLVSAGAFAIVVGLWAPLCAMILGRAVSAPIERLTITTREVVEEGKQSQISALPVERNDEVGMLTERFNDLLDLMRDLSAGANAISKGDLRVVIAGKGELPDAFRGMLESLRAMVRQISETSVDLGSAATEIFAASQEQEAAAASQSSAMEEISRTMDSLSESAAHVSDAVQGVLSNAERTLANTDGMVRRIGELSTHAGRIGEILEVIREIADKSDLLALNGSLEASRAGEGGQGFALVAAEMRRLAERVTASVQDVKRLVSDIRESGSSTVMATEESRRLAEGTTEAARQITFVTQQQRSGTEQVSQSIKGIADVVSQAVTATSQTRTSAESLKGQADRLADLVRRFEVAHAVVR